MKETDLTEKAIRPEIDLAYNREVLYYKDIDRFHSKFGKSFKTVDCVACWHKKHFKLTEKNGFEFRKCEECETVFICPRPDESALEWWYSHSEQIKHSVEILKKTGSARILIYKDRIQKIFERISVPVKSVLEIGCGSGMMLAELKKRRPDIECTGIDRSAEASAAAEKENLRCINISAEEYAKNAKEKYDLILAFEVLEHAFNPCELLSSIRGLLEKKGVIYMTMPNYIAYDFLEIGDVYRNFEGPMHLNYFNPGSLEKLFKSAGYNQMEIFCDGILDVDIMANYHANKKKILTGFWNYIYNNKDKHDGFLKDFQGLLRQYRLSGNMTVVARN